MRGLTQWSDTSSRKPQPLTQACMVQLKANGFTMRRASHSTNYGPGIVNIIIIVTSLALYP